MKKVLLSTGHGRLHFVETIRSLVSNGLKPKVVTGWIPSGRMPKVVDVFGPLFRRDHLSRRLAVRREFLDLGCECVGMFWVELEVQILQLMARMKLIDHGWASAVGWRAFGKRTIPHLNGGVFHVRSGAGQGGAILEAKRRGMYVIVDHSIAHPAVMQSNLEELHAKHGKSFHLGANNPFWKCVVSDCQMADLLLVNSDYVKETFKSSGFDESKIKVLYLGVREDFMGLKRNWDVRGQLRLVFTGAFCLRKGAADLVEAARLLDDLNLDFEIIVAGDATEGISLLESHPGLTSRFKFVGFLPQDDLKDLLIESDIYVFPSYAEGCAKSVMEAMAIGLPVICTHESGAPIVDGETGMLVDLGDVDKLVSAIVECFEDPSLRERLGTGASAFVNENCSWNSYGASLLSLYEGQSE